MRICVVLLFVASSFLFSGRSGIAGETSYECVIRGMKETDDSGDLVASGLEDLHLEVEANFVIDRITGRIIGSFLDNARANEIEVVTAGGNGFSFRVLSKWDAGASYVIVDEFVESDEKPFTALAIQGDVFHGVCR